MSYLRPSLALRLLLLGCLSFLAVSCTTCVIPANVRQKASTFTIRVVPSDHPTISQVNYQGSSQQWANAFGPLTSALGGIAAAKPQEQLHRALRALSPSPAHIIEDQVAQQLMAHQMKRVTSNADVTIRIGSPYDLMTFYEAAPGTGRTGFQLGAQFTVSIVDRAGVELWKGRTGGVSHRPWPSVEEILSSPATLSRMVREAASWSGKRLVGVDPTK